MRSVIVGLFRIVGAIAIWLFLALIAVSSVKLGILWLRWAFGL
jgi:hypothetical protein